MVTFVTKQDPIFADSDFINSVFDCTRASNLNDGFISHQDGGLNEGLTKRFNREGFSSPPTEDIWGLAWGLRPGGPGAERVHFWIRFL